MVRHQVYTAVVSLSFVATVACAQPPTYQVVDVDLGRSVTPWAINRQGAITGSNADGRAILINKGVTTDLGLDAPGFALNRTQVVYVWHQ